MGAALVGGTLGSLGIAGEAAGDPPGCKRNVKHTTERMDHGGELVEKHGFDPWREVVGAEGTSRR